MEQLTQRQILETLGKNYELLLWEYCCCYTRNKYDCNIFDSTLFPLPTMELYRTAPDEIMPSINATVHWATEVSTLSQRDAEEQNLVYKLVKKIF